MSTESLINQANGRLRAGKIGVTIEATIASISSLSAWFIRPAKSKKTL
ncbi:MAG: hypothetical protein J7647_18200 [Cyanobacteria bacterium SBLK]|nr:hypothetical protein [Cyanobacteria bacterium SBLK]